VIAVLGHLSPAEAELLRPIRVAGTTCVAILVDSSTWLNLPPPARAEAEAAHEAAAMALLRNGWRVIGANHGSGLAALWPQVARGSQGFAVRAALAETVSAAHSGVQAP
jgi:hypothetical protein